jgi:hypothetical protein
VLEHRTKQIERPLLLAELAVACEGLTEADVTEVLVSFGWDSSLPIGEMWKDQVVPTQEVVAFVERSERSGISVVGKSDIFVASEGFLFTLCHEGDAHVAGSSQLAEQLVQRWQLLGYEPYAIQPGA